MSTRYLSRDELDARPVRRTSLGRNSLVYLLFALVPVVVAIVAVRLFTHGATDASVAKPPPVHDAMTGVLFACFVIVTLAGIFGLVARALHQSPVVGEMIAGIVLGPSVIGAFAPGLEADLFPTQTATLIDALAQLGVVFFMFLIGLEIPLTMLRRVGGSVLPLGHAALAVPFALGVGLALLLRGRYEPEQLGDVPFVLFVGLALSVTAFPVLARILSDRSLVGTRIGTTGLAVAGVGDVTAWCVLSLVVAEIRNTSSYGFARTVVAVVCFAAVLWFAGRPALARLLRIAQGRLPDAATSAALAAFVLLCAAATSWIGVHAIFGAFLAGLVVPRSSRAVVTFSTRTEGLTLWVLMPLFFATIGLRTHLGAVFTGSALLPVLGVLAVAVGGKVLGAGLSAWMSGESARFALGLGAMMNCRGLTELVILNVGLSLGAIGPDLFSILVLMTVVTTIMTDPLLRLLRIGTPPDRVDVTVPSETGGTA